MEGEGTEPQPYYNKRITRAKNLLRNYFHGCIELLQKELDGKSAIIQCKKGANGWLEFLDPPKWRTDHSHEHEHHPEEAKSDGQPTCDLDNSLFEVEIRLCKVLDASAYWNPLERQMDSESEKKKHAANNLFPKEYCNEYHTTGKSSVHADQMHTDHHSGSGGAGGSVERRPSIFLPIGSTLICMYLRPKGNGDVHGKSS